jgi:hypothetical protein
MQVKAKEFRVVGLGGHQDLDDYLDMAVVCSQGSQPPVIHCIQQKGIASFEC